MNPDKTSVECSYFGFDLTDDPAQTNFCLWMLQKIELRFPLPTKDSSLMKNYVLITTNVNHHI